MWGGGSGTCRVRPPHVGRGEGYMQGGSSALLSYWYSKLQVHTLSLHWSRLTGHKHSTCMCITKIAHACACTLVTDIAHACACNIIEVENPEGD